MNEAPFLALTAIRKELARRYVSIGYEKQFLLHIIEEVRIAVRFLEVDPEKVYLRSLVENTFRELDKVELSLHHKPVFSLKQDLNAAILKLLVSRHLFD